MAIYFGRFSDLNDVLDSFEPASGSLIPVEGNVLFASYGGDTYNGAATVIFSHEDKLYEVNGSHCSCYGLEDQWEPEETDVPSLGMRGRPGESTYHYLSDHDEEAVTAYWELVDGLIDESVMGDEDEADVQEG